MFKRSNTLKVVVAAQTASHALVNQTDIALRAYKTCQSATSDQRTGVTQHENFQG